MLFPKPQFFVLKQYKQNWNSSGLGAMKGTASKNKLVNHQKLLGTKSKIGTTHEEWIAILI